MKIKPGYLYHIKDEFFKVVDDDKLMRNKPNGGGRPTLICKVKGSEFLWAIPVSSQTDKYKNLLKQSQKKYKDPFNIIIGTYNNKETAFLLQNMYPINEQYIDHIHKIGPKAIHIYKDLYDKITAKVKRILDLTNRNYKVTQTNISKMMTVVEPRPYSEHITKKYVAYMKAQEKEKAQEQEQARKKQEFKKEVEKNKNYKIKVTEVEYD